MHGDSVLYINHLFYYQIVLGTCMTLSKLGGMHVAGAVCSWGNLGHRFDGRTRRAINPLTNVAFG